MVQPRLSHLAASAIVNADEEDVWLQIVGGRLALPLLNRNEADVFGNFLAGRTDRKLDEHLRQASRIAIRVIVSRPGVRPGLIAHSSGRRRLAVDRYHLETAGLHIGQADVTDAVCVLAN